MSNIKYFIFMFWCFSRFIDFITGYVEFSLLRFTFSIILGSIIFLNLPFQINIKNPKKVIFRFGEFVLILSCILLGYSLFLSRFLREANMGETLIFKESIENTALYGGWLWNQYEGVSHFAYHNSPGFLLFVPFIWIFGHFGWYIISFLHSCAIVITNYIIGTRFLTNSINYKFALLFFIAMFLAMYTQHAKFIESRFAMLGISMFIYGLLSKNTIINVLGFIICLLFRETVIIPCVAITIFTRPYPLTKNTKWFIVISGIVWSLFTVYLVNELNPSGISGNGFTGTGIGIFDNLNLKFAHILRLLNFGPLILFSLPGLAGLMSEMFFIVFASHEKFYSLSWHLWIIPGTIVIMYSINVLISKYGDSKVILNHYFTFVGLTCIWQFLTTFHPRLF